MAPQGMTNHRLEPDRKTILRSNKTAGPDPIPDDCIRIGNKLYNAKKIESWHPGGKIFIQAFTGHDATEPFVAYHRRRFPHKMAKVREAFVREDRSVSSKVEDAFDDYLELSDRVAKVVPRLKDFGGLHFYLKSLLFFVIFCLAEGYAHIYADYNPLLIFFIGFWAPILGTTVGHEGHHGSASPNPLVNAVFRLGYNLNGESTLHWIQYHLVEHHPNVNNLQIDPEKIASMAPRAGSFSLFSILRINPLDQRKERHLGQHIYFIVYMMFYGFLNLFFSIVYSITGQGSLKISKSLWRYRITGLLVNFLLFFRYVILPYYQTGSILTILTCFLALCIGYGLHQGFWAVIIHSYDGVHLTSDTIKERNPKEENFLYKQIASTSSCGGAVTGWINGGINYHIEHHLFPRMNHHHFPKVQPIVREFCAEKGIPYRFFPSVWDNFRSFVRHLHFLGHNDTYDNMAVWSH